MSVINYKVRGAVGTSMSYANFIVIEENQYFFIGDSYHGNQYCFSDLDGDGAIDFLNLRNNRASYLWDIHGIQVYKPMMLHLEKPDEELPVPTIPDRWIIECEDEYIVLTEDELRESNEKEINFCDK